MSLKILLESVLRGFYVEIKGTACGSTLRNHNREQVNGRGNPCGPWQEVDRCCHFFEIPVRDRLRQSTLLCSDSVEPLFAPLLRHKCTFHSTKTSISDVTSYDFHNLRGEGRSAWNSVSHQTAITCWCEVEPRPYNIALTRSREGEFTCEPLPAWM